MTLAFFFAFVAQLVELLICNQMVIGSNPVEGSKMVRSTSGLSHRPFTAKSRVRIPYGLQLMAGNGGPM